MALAMIGELSQREIGEMYGCKQPDVSNAKTKAIALGYMLKDRRTRTEAGNDFLKQKGFDLEE
jgi:hypothetical protein